MNDNDIKYNNNEKNVYRATSNLNTAIENPQININSAVGINIKDVDSFSNSSESLINSSNLNYNQTLQNFNNDNNFQNINANVGNDFQNINANVVNDFQNINAGVSNHFVNPDINLEGNSNNFINKNDVSFQSSSMEVGVNSSSVGISGNDNVVYEPVIKEKKKTGVSFKVTRELKVMLFIIFILLLFVLVVPYIYDFFKDLQLAISTR